jgi:hypothetical protein
MEEALKKAFLKERQTKHHASQVYRSKGKRKPRLVKDENTF